MRKASVLGCVLIAGFFFSMGHAARTQLADERLADFLRRNESSLLKEFADLLAIPNIASDTVNIRRNAEAIVALLAGKGVNASLLEGQGGPPAVYGEKKAAGASRTVLFYAHYDGQPVDPSQWKTDPWKAVVKDGRIYARSSSDDKAPIIALAAALAFLKEESASLSVNLKFLFEGEEEAGSSHLRAILEQNRERLRTDAIFICDGPVDQSGRSQVVFGARGTLGLEMTVYGPNHPLHSGHYGNWAPNPAALLAGLLAGMRDADGRILIDGFNRDVRPLSTSEREALRGIPDIDERLMREYGLAWTEAGNARLIERIQLPALNIRGLRSGGVGSQAANAVPPEAAASIDFRLVPDQVPENVKRLVEAHVRKAGFHILTTQPSAEERLRFPRIVKFEWEEGYPPYRLALDDAFGAAVHRALSKALSEPPLRLPSLGGSVPMKMFADVLGAPVVILPIANYDNNQHGPDENLKLKNLWDGIGVFAAIMSGLGPNWK